MARSKAHWTKRKDFHWLLGILDHTSPACLPNAFLEDKANAFLEDKANAVLEFSYESATTARGGHVRGEAWGDIGRDRLLRMQGWRHALGRRDTPEGLWPMEDPRQDRDSPEGLQPAGDPCWSSNSEKSRVEEKNSKNCRRGADRNHYTIIHYKVTYNPATHAQTLI